MGEMRVLQETFLAIMYTTVLTLMLLHKTRFLSHKLSKKKLLYNPVRCLHHISITATWLHHTAVQG